MRKVGLFALITALTSLIANFAKADTVVTSKTYVDAKISSSADISSTSTTTAPNEKAVYDAISSATSATSNLLTQVISNADTSHAPSGDAVYDALDSKQNKIDSYNSATTGPSVLIDSTQSGVVGKRAILDMNAVDGLVWDDLTDSPSVNSMIMDAGAVGSVIGGSVDSKQNKIDSTGTAPFEDAEGSVVTTTDSAGVVGERFIWTADGGDGTAWDINEYYDSNVARNAVRNAIPTVQAVEAGLHNKQNKIDSYNSATTGPSVLIDSTVDGVVGKRAILDMENFDAAYNWDDLIDNSVSDMIMDAGAVSLAIGQVYDEIPDVSGFQNKIDSTGVAPFDYDGGSVVTTTDSAGVVGERFIWTADDGDAASWNIDETYNSATTRTAVRNAIPTVGAVEAGLFNKQNKLGGSGSAGKVVTATANEGNVTYTTIKTAVDSSSDLITAGAVKTYADSKVSAASSISTTSTTTAPNEKAVYDAINTVQSAVDTLASCTHTCADTACELITISCVNLAS